MEKQLSTIGYWLALICTVLSLIFRLLYFLNITPPHVGAPGGSGISYMSFLHGGALFFLLTIASCAGRQIPEPDSQIESPKKRSRSCSSSSLRQP
jgi:hypothetical protein